MGALLVASVVAVVGAAGLSVGLVAFARSGSNAERKQRAAASGMDSSQAKTIDKAEKDIHAAQKLAYTVREAQIRDAAKDALERAQKIVTTMKKQPDEIRKGNQFFGYYLPTIAVVLQKYLLLEEGGRTTPELIENTLTYFSDTSHAFDLQYDNLFKDEELDLTVEAEAMQMSLKREGLS